MASPDAQAITLRLIQSKVLEDSTPRLLPLQCPMPPGPLPGCLPASLDVRNLKAIDKADPLIFQIVESVAEWAVVGRPFIGSAPRQPAPRELPPLGRGFGSDQRSYLDLDHPGRHPRRPRKPPYSCGALQGGWRPSGGAVGRPCSTSTSASRRAYRSASLRAAPSV